MFKVIYEKYPIMSDGSTGNIKQEQGVGYTNAEMDEITELFNSALKKEEILPCIISVELVKGRIF